MFLPSLSSRDSAVSLIESRWNNTFLFYVRVKEGGGEVAARELHLNIVELDSSRGKRQYMLIQFCLTDSWSLSL